MSLQYKIVDGVKHRTNWRGKAPAPGTPARAKYDADKAAAIAAGAYIPAKHALAQSVANSLMKVPQKSTSLVSTTIEPDETNETDEQRVIRIAAKFDIAYTYIQAMANGHVRGAILSGAAGVGKSSLIEKIFEHAKEHQNKTYQQVHGVVTGVELFKGLYQNRQSHQTYILDDADGVFSEENTLSVMKAALDTGKTRKLSWLSDGYSLKKDHVDTEFIYEGSMLFITNKSFDAYINKGKGAYVEHMKALMSRCVYIDLGLHTPKDLLAWVTHLVRKQHILVQHDMSHQQEEEILDWMKENLFKFKNQISIRTALQIAQMYKLFASNWENVAKELLLTP
jgi:hypothetical protein